MIRTMPDGSPIRVSLRKVRLSSAGYTFGRWSMYFGRGEPLWYAEPLTADTGIQALDRGYYLRALDREGARYHVLHLFELPDTAIRR